MTVMFEGTPTYPDAGVWWRIVEDRSVSVFYTSPTALNVLRSFGEEFVKQSDRSFSGCSGPRWPGDFIKRGCGIDASSATRDCPSSTRGGKPARRFLDRASSQGDAIKTVERYVPFFDVFDASGRSGGESRQRRRDRGCLCFAPPPWPTECFTTSSARTTPSRNSYFNVYEGGFFLGRPVAKNSGGYYLFLSGRLDDVMSVSGHRIGTAEVESALVQHTDGASKPPWCRSLTRSRARPSSRYQTRQRHYKSQTSAEHELIQNVLKRDRPVRGARTNNHRQRLTEDAKRQNRAEDAEENRRQKRRRSHRRHLGYFDPGVVDDIIDAENKSAMTTHETTTTTTRSIRTSDVHKNSYSFIFTIWGGSLRVY